jgi:hypothetical protein
VLSVAVLVRALMFVRRSPILMASGCDMRMKK